MESDIYTMTNVNNLTNNILDCLNNSLMNEISNISCDYVFNTSSPNVEKYNPKLVPHKNLIYGICSVIIVTNLIVIISSGIFSKTKWQHRNSFILLGNVAIADVILALIVTIDLSIPKRYLSYSICLLKTGCRIAAALASVYSVCLIAIDRYLYIVHGMYYQQWVKKSRMRLMILSIWLLSLVVGFLPATGWANDKRPSEQHCLYVKLAPLSLLCLASLVGIIPVIISCILYLIILMKALKTVDQLQVSVEAAIPANNNKLRVFRGGFQRNEASIRNNLNLAMSKDNAENNSKDNTPDHKRKDSRMSWNKFRCTVCKKKERAKPEQTTNPGDLSKWKAVKIVLFTTGSIVITWVPEVIAVLMYVVCDKEKTPDFCSNLEAAIANPLAILSLSNSILNPLIYAWFHSRFLIFLKIFKWIQTFKWRRTTVRTNSSTKSSSVIVSRL